MVAFDEYIFVAQEDSLLLHIYTHRGDSIATVDCTEPVLASVQSELYCGGIMEGVVIRTSPPTGSEAPIQKESHAHITCMAHTSQLLLLGTSVGLVVAIPLSLAAGLPPFPQVLPGGHAGFVHTLLAVPLGGETLLISGGKGAEGPYGLTTPPENCCLMMWKSL